MKHKPSLFFVAFLFLVFSCLGSPGWVAAAEDPILKIQGIPDQNSVKVGMMFLIDAQVTNSSSDTSVDFWSNSCSYEKHWVTDNAAVFIQSWTCNENVLEQVTLDPSGVYSKKLILYVPQIEKTGPVSFRLGFKRMSENGDVAEPLWSDSVTMNVVALEEAAEDTTPPVADAASQASGETSAALVETDGTSPAAEPATQGSDQVPVAPAETQEASPAPVQAGSQPLVFRDPGVPIKVPPGEGFSIALASNPSTGFRWKMTLPQDQKAVNFLGSEHIVSGEVMPGVPGEEVYKFKAMTPGSTNVDFVYERPWEPKVAPTRKIFTILVQES